MPQLSKNNAATASDGLLSAQMDTSIHTTLHFTRKKEEDTELKEPRNFLEQNTHHGIEHLLQLITSLESCNAALFVKLVQTQRELAALKQLSAPTSPGTASNACTGQTYGWERKLTRMGWRPL